MGTSKCCCYLVIGIILLWVLSAWQQETNWGQPQDGEDWQWGQPDGTEGTGETAPMVTVSFASDHLTLGFADKGTPLGTAYTRWDITSNYLKTGYSNPPSFQVQVQAGDIILIRFTLDGKTYYVNFHTPASAPSDNFLEVEEITAFVSTYVFWRVVYWEEGVLKEVEVY